jgi:predicted transposase/invertase (TIGR01784 family)
MNPVLREQFEKGMEQGINQGISQGKEEGKQEGKQEGFHYGRIETAKNMLERGFNMDMIAEITGLDIDDIKKLK